MPQHQEEEEDWVDEIVVVGERPERGENGGSSGGGASPYGGLGYYPIEEGDVGENYFGLPPGSPLGPYPDAF